jgi:hypothetical protein
MAPDISKYMLKLSKEEYQERVSNKHPYSKRRPFSRARHTGKLLQMPAATSLTTAPPNPRQRAERVDWLQPAYWKPINASTRVSRFHAVEMVREVQKGLAGEDLYKTLAPGTAQRWIDTTGPVRRWTQDILEKVEERRRRTVVVVRLGHLRALVRRFSKYRRGPMSVSIQRAGPDAKPCKPESP